MKKMFIAKLVFAFGFIMHLTYQSVVTPQDKLVRIINISKDFDDNGYALINVTIKNDSTGDFIINKLALKLYDLKANKSKSVGESKVLLPLKSWDMSLPKIRKTQRTYQPKVPVVIGAKDAATVTIRFYINQDNEMHLPENVGLFTFKIIFYDASKNMVESPSLQVGKQ